MRILLLILTAIAAINASAQIAPDKQLHYAAGVVSGAVGYELIYRITKDKKKARWGGYATSILAGTLKEVIDSQQLGNRFDPNDLLATTLGGITVGITIKLFDKR